MIYFKCLERFLYRGEDSEDVCNLCYFPSYFSSLPCLHWFSIILSGQNFLSQFCVPLGRLNGQPGKSKTFQASAFSLVESSCL